MRIYGDWAGSSKGVREDKDRCVVSVHGIGWQDHQCSRMRGHGQDGLFCKQHGKKHTLSSRSVPADKEN